MFKNIFRPTSQPAVENPPAYNEVVKVEEPASLPGLRVAAKIKRITDL